MLPSNDNTESQHLKTVAPVDEIDEKNPLRDLFTLWYHHGSNPHSLTKNFRMKTIYDPNTKLVDMRPIVARVRRHCDNMGYRFIRVQPFLSSLDFDERFNAQG